MNSIIKLLLFSTTAILANSCEQSPQEISAITGSNYHPAREHRLANIESKVKNLLAQLTLEEKISLVHANGKFSIPAVERLGIHEMWMADGPHGVRYEISRHSWAPAGWEDDYSTYLPPLTSVAASWNPEMATLHGNVLGSEARHRRKDIILGPGVNLARLPLYGRNFEYMGEDPYLAAKLVVPAIKAIQNNDVAATLKHFALNTQELNRSFVDAKPDERTLREVYLPVFEAGVKEGNVLAIMGAYNSFRGTNTNQSKYLIMDILKGEWGYKGVVLTDWGANINTHDAAVNGLDIEMGTRVDEYDDYFLGLPFLKMIQEGKLPVSVLDDKVARILRVQLSIGMMDKARLSGQRNTDQHRKDARTIAEEGIVLLKNNESLLPLNKNTLKNVLVMGPNADKAHGAGGGSSEVKSLYEITPLQGLKEKLGEGINIRVLRARSRSPLQTIASDYIASRHWTGTTAWELQHFAEKARETRIGTSWISDSTYRSPENSALEYVTMKTDIKPLLDGLHVIKLSAFGKVELKVNGEVLIEHQGYGDEIVSHSIALRKGETYAFELNYDGNKNFILGWDAPGKLFSSEAEYISAAKEADAVIYYGGLSHGDDRESIDRSNMKLPNGQDEVIANLLAANKNTVVFLVGGSAVEMPWVDRARAILWGWYGGMEGGRAYADVLFGDVNPGGKMPITLPKALEDTAPIALNDYNEKEAFYSEGVFIGYRWFEKQGIKPLFPFGHGLSYTQFEYRDIRLSSDKMSGKENITLELSIQNTGTVFGAEVAQLYLHDRKSSIERPKNELKGFAKVYLEPGESQKVSFTLTKRDLSFWDVKSNDWKAEPGDFQVNIGSSLKDIRQQIVFEYLQ